MSYSTPKLAVRDSFDDEDVSDDVEDEVFIRDGRNGFKLDEERGVKRPLMAPRRKLKTSHFHNEGFKSSTCKVLCVPCCYGLLALTALLGLLAVIVVLILWFPIPFDQIAFWRVKPVPTVLVPCTEISTEDIWIKTFSKLTSESALQVNDVNKDGVLDVIIGFGSGADKPEEQDIWCTLYFNGVTPCGGGLLALDGRTGLTLWQHWCAHSIYWVDCGADLNQDGVKDCLISGRGGILEAIKGHDGSRVWMLDTSSTPNTGNVENRASGLNVYAGRFVHDLDGDGIQDVIAAHTEETNVNDSGRPLIGHLMMVSGRTGRLLYQVPTPQGEEAFYPPQVLVGVDGQPLLLWGTGGIHSPGGLYVGPLTAFTSGHIGEEEALYWDKFKGVLSPPALVDINQDGHEDIIVSTFNSSVLAFDGRSFQQLWNYTFIGSESASSPVPGYFNDDEIPDVLVKYQTGPGSPTYYCTQTRVLDGKTGRSILDSVMIDTSGMQQGGLAVSVEGFGNDLLLHWGGNCLHYEGRSDPFSFLPEDLLDSVSNIDLCKARFNSTLVTKLFALSEHLEPPGAALYYSENRKKVEFQDYVNTTAEVLKYVNQHPDFWAMYSKEKVLTKQPSADFSGESSVGVLRNGGSNFHHKESSILHDQRKSPGYYFSGRDYNVPNRGRNRELGGRTFSGGEDEEMLPAYPSNSEYPDVRKHGMEYSNHASAPWRHPWHNAEIRPEDVPDVSDGNNYQDAPPGRVYDGSLPIPEQDFDIPGMYYSPSNDAYSLGQREERTTFPESAVPHGPRLKEDKHGQERDKRSNDAQIKGLQKLTSAGVLLPSFSNALNNSIDVVFATYWIPAKEDSHVLLQEHMECVQKKLAERPEEDEKYSGLDHIAVKNAIAQECLNLKPKEDKEPEVDAEIAKLIIKMGQMTVYRLRLRCNCRSLSPDEKCSSILPFEHQSWPQVFGVQSNGYFKPRHR